MGALPEAAIRERANHEAAHAVAWWWLDKRHFLGRNYVFPRLDHVAVMRTEGDALRSAPGFEVPASVGLCAGDAMMPQAIVRATLEQPPGLNAREHRKFMRRAAFADCVHIMAGTIAEYLERGEPILSWQDWDDWVAELSHLDGCAYSGDHWLVWQRVPFLGRHWRLLLRQAFELADDIVRCHPWHIYEIADALMWHGQVDGKEVYRLFDAAGPAVRRQGR